MFAAFTLYFLGVYMHYKLAGNVIKRSDLKEKKGPQIVAAFFWPFAAVYYLFD